MFTPFLNVRAMCSVEIALINDHYYYSQELGVFACTLMGGRNDNCESTA